MRVLHIDLEKGFRGGEGQVLALMGGLRARGVEQALAARAGGELAGRAGEQGFEVVPVPPRPWDPRAIWAVERHALYEGSILHAHTASAHSLALRAARRTAPVVVTRRVDFPVRANFLSRHKYRAPNLHFIAISEAIRRILEEGGVAADCITVVPSGVDPTRFRGATGRDRLRAEWGVPTDGLLLGTVGAYVEHKDPLNLLRALEELLPRFSRLHAVFVGDGALRGEMEAFLASRLAPHRHRVTLAGWRSDVGDCLAAMDLFVMPSRLEGLCTSLLDAQAVGLPCVATAAGGMVDIVMDGENGLLAPPEHPSALAEALARLLENEDLRRALAARGPAVVERRFTVDRMVEGTLAVYRHVLSVPL